MFRRPQRGNSSMIYTKNGSATTRQAVSSRGTGMTHWSAEYFGPRDTTTAAARGVHALVTDMAPDETILPHFHGTAQFQIFTGGCGKMARHDVQPLVVQFKDHHTAYGPVVAGAQGLTFFAMRMEGYGSAPVYLNKPGYREQLQPSRRRNLLSAPLVLSTAPVLQHRSVMSCEPAYAETYDDGLSAQLLRLGAGMTAMTPDPRSAGGLYLFVVNGSLDYNGASLPLWSMMALEPAEAAFEIRAGDQGLEVLLLQFPRENA